jgi:hypothetical protein
MSNPTAGLSACLPPMQLLPVFEAEGSAIAQGSRTAAE